MKIKFLLLRLSAVLGGLLLIMNNTAQGMKSKQRTSGQYFMENQGQITDQFYTPRSDIDFKLAAGNGLNIFFGKGKIEYQWTERKISMEEEEEEEHINMYRMEVELLNANPHSLIIKEGRQDLFERYFLSWVNKSNRNEGVVAHAYEKIIYKEVYPYIDWVLYINDHQQLEHDFIVHPGGNVDDIQLRYNGATTLNLLEDGSLIATTPKGIVTESAPYSFDEEGREVASSFKLEDQILSFNVGKYNGVLTIDPILEWGTYFGGVEREDAYDMVMDKYGAIYLVGHTRSINNIATTGAHKTVFDPNGNNYDAFLSKWTAEGALLWATYYGGVGVDQGRSVGVDTNGYVYLGGSTNSQDGISTPGAYNESINSQHPDAFLVKFDTAGVRIWGTYFGGWRAEDNNLSLAIDSLNQIYMAGGTISTDLPTTAGAHATQKNGNLNTQDVFLAKFSDQGDLIFCTYYGGSLDEYVKGIALDQNLNIYLTGYTNSLDLITTSGAHQEFHGGGRDAFLAVFDPNGQLSISTYFGGEGNDVSDAIDVSDDRVIIGGYSLSQTGISTPNAFKEIADPSTYLPDAFFAVFDLMGTLEWATYYGGEKADEIRDLKIEGTSIYICGDTGSEQGISTPGSFQEDLVGPGTNLFFVEFSISGERLRGTYVGAEVAERAVKMLTKNQFELYLAGNTLSASGIATPNAHQTILGGLYDAFLMKFNLCPAPLISDLTGATEICEGSILNLEVADSEGAQEFVWMLPDGWLGNSEDSTIDITVGSTLGTVRVYALSACGGMSDTLSLEIDVLPAPNPQIVNQNQILTTTQGYDSYQWMKDGVDIDQETGPIYVANANGHYQVRVTATNGCIGVSEAEIIDFININDLKLKEGIRIYPNPMKEEFIIHVPQTVWMTIYDVQGKMVRNKTRLYYGDHIIGVAEYSPGIYFLHCFEEKGSSVVHKIIIH